MTASSQLAVEIRKGADHLDIWVDANNNGERDDDDVNIYITSGGGFYTVSPTFKHALDSAIQTRIKELAITMLTEPGGHTHTESKLRDLALELVLKATADEAAPAEAAPVTDPDQMMKNLKSFF
ncbi:MAG: hypothetical protein ACKVOE_08245 [Rickettsiales bacterium]